MADCMIFPDTVEEFMEQYKVVDTEQVYTNGTEFVPIYRMIQWFQHEPEIVRCKDCKYYDEVNQPYTQTYCRKHSIDISDQDFCSRAERKDT